MIKIWKYEEKNEIIWKFNIAFILQTACRTSLYSPIRIQCQLGHCTGSAQRDKRTQQAVHCRKPVSNSRVYTYMAEFCSSRQASGAGATTMPAVHWGHNHSPLFSLHYNRLHGLWSEAGGSRTAGLTVSRNSACVCVCGGGAGYHQSAATAVPSRRLRRVLRAAWSTRLTRP